MSFKFDFIEIINKYDLKIKGIIHVGAHKGQEVNLYEKLGIFKIILFEPIPKIFEELKIKFEGKYLIFNTALGNSQGEVIMNIENVNDNKSSSILEPHKHIEYYPHIIFTEKLKVKLTKLDNFYSFHQDYNFLVIDTQGYELEVLKGGSNFLEKIDYIICEVNKEELYMGCPIVTEIDSFLSLFGFNRVETSWSWDNETWGDALYIKK